MKLPFRKNKEFLTALYNILGFYPHNIELYRIAFSHKSLSFRNDNTNKDRKGRERRQRSENTSKPLNNERLEYLGDAVLETVVSDILFRHFPNKREGFLTSTRSKIVQREALNKLAADMGLEQLIQAAQGTRMAHTNIGGNAFEALMGAIYLDRGFHHCQWFIANRVIDHFVDLDNVAQKEVNFKSKLLEWSQKNRININFRDVANEGDEKGFRTTITLEGISLGRGAGRSKKESQQIASKEALTRMRCDEKLYDSIFRAKEKRTAMEAEESFALPKIDEIEASINKDTQCKGNKKTETPVLEKANQDQVTLEADLAYNTAYDENADFEIIDTPPAVHMLTAADYKAKGIPAPPIENELEAAEESEKASRRKKHSPKTVNEAVKGFKKKGREPEQPVQPTGKPSLKEVEDAPRKEKPVPLKKQQQPKAMESVGKAEQLPAECEKQQPKAMEFVDETDNQLAEHGSPHVENNKPHLENNKPGVESDTPAVKRERQQEKAENPLRGERPFENQTALPEEVIEDALLQASDAAFATLQAAPKAQKEPCMSYLLAAVKAQAEQREQLAESESQPAAEVSDEAPVVPSTVVEHDAIATDTECAVTAVQAATVHLEMPTIETLVHKEVETAKLAVAPTGEQEPEYEVAATPTMLDEAVDDHAVQTIADSAVAEAVTDAVATVSEESQPQSVADGAVNGPQYEQDTDDVTTTAICDIKAGMPGDDDFHALAQKLVTDTQIISFPIDEVGDEEVEDNSENPLSTTHDYAAHTTGFDDGVKVDEEEEDDDFAALAITPVTVPGDEDEDVADVQAVVHDANDLHVLPVELQSATEAHQSAPEVDLAEAKSGQQLQKDAAGSAKADAEAEKAAMPAVVQLQDFIITKDLISVELTPFDEASSEVGAQDSCSLQPGAVAPKLRHLSLDDFVFGMDSEAEMTEPDQDDSEVLVPKNRKPRRKRRKPSSKPAEPPGTEQQETPVKAAAVPVRNKRPMPENAVGKPAKVREQSRVKAGVEPANWAESPNAQPKPQRRYRRPGRKNEG